MNCQEVRERVLGSGSTEAAPFEVKQHLRECRDCALEAQISEALLGAIAAMETPRADLVGAILARRRSRASWPTTLLQMAVFLVLTLCLGQLFPKLLVWVPGASSVDAFLTWPIEKASWVLAWFVGGFDALGELVHGYVKPLQGGLFRGLAGLLILAGLNLGMLVHSGKSGGAA